ncbi:MAG TPA: hypothetical protein VK104_01185 [Burkholderiaceae bacterium]|nr:hypothetical protein [Burkholderiaceae bacterium]
MKNIGPETRLTDALERELMAAAIQEQMELQPFRALKRVIQNLFSKLTPAQRSVSGQTAEAAQ